MFSKSDGQDAVASGNAIDGSPAQVNWIEEQIKTFERSMDHSDPDLLSLRMEKMIACLNKIRVLSQLTEQDYYDINQQHDNPQSCWMNLMHNTLLSLPTGNVIIDDSTVKSWWLTRDLALHWVIWMSIWMKKHSHEMKE